ncbi:MAG: hypothetical protein AB1486_31750 [Planctomycetota bacterium]
MMSSVPDLTGDGLPDLLVSGTSPDHEERSSVFVYGLKSLKRVVPDTTAGASEKVLLKVRAPALANQSVLLLWSGSVDQGTMLLGRHVPLDPDQLFHWSLSHPHLITLDSEGRGCFERKVSGREPLLGLSLYAAYVAIDPLRPGRLRAVSNAERLSP